MAPEGPTPGAKRKDSRREATCGGPGRALAGPVAGPAGGGGRRGRWDAGRGSETRLGGDNDGHGGLGSLTEHKGIARRLRRQGPSEPWRCGCIDYLVPHLSPAVLRSPRGGRRNPGGTAGRTSERGPGQVPTVAPEGPPPPFLLQRPRRRGPHPAPFRDGPDPSPPGPPGPARRRPPARGGSQRSPSTGLWKTPTRAPVRRTDPPGGSAGTSSQGAPGGAVDRDRREGWADGRRRTPFGGTVPH